MWPPSILVLPCCIHVLPCCGLLQYMSSPAAAAWRFAPVIYNHPLERYHLQSPNLWFEASEVYYQDYKNASESMYAWHSDNWLDTLMFMPK